jgi:hypothetical protein
LPGQNQRSFYSLIRPYLFISLVGILAFAPVSFMQYALKNDITAIEYPINYFISQSIHNLEVPYWFNTWGMGFPLQSNLTWGIYSTPQVVFSTVFNYNIYVLHIEFMFFILLSGWGMFHLLKKFLVKDETLALILSICYMLSGFIVGSSQWLLYITAAAFIPILINSLLQLLHSPSLRTAMLFAVVYCLMFTSVYAAFNIITTYSLIVFLLIYLSTLKTSKKEKIKQVIYLGLAGMLTAVLCFPCLYYTAELLNYIDRGNGIGNTEFFNSNYLHPASLSGMLLPFSSVKMSFANTEGTMFHSYAGLFTLLFLPVAVRQVIKEKSRPAIILLVATLLFLLFSFGGITPLRNALNILPGFSYFRNPGIFRLYFIIALIFFLGITFKNISWNDLLDKQNRVLKSTFYILAATCLIVLLMNISVLKTFSSSSVNELIKNISYKQAIVASAAIQLVILLTLFFLIIKKHFKPAKLLFIADMIVNTIICTPYFTVSSYSLADINKIYASQNEFPVQRLKVNETPTTFTDNKMNTWYNVNVYQKQVSSNDSYRGPLTLKQFSSFLSDTALSKTFDHGIVFAGADTGATNNKIVTVLQEPTHIRVSLEIHDETTITAMQNYFPGWKAYYNDRPVEFINKDKPGLTVSVPKGVGTVDFKYEKKEVWLSALILHFVIIIFLLFQFYLIIKRSKHFGTRTPLTLQH